MIFDTTISDSRSRLDRLQLVAIAGLMVLGAAFVYSATMNDEAARAVALHSQMWFHQIIWYSLGTTAAILVCLVDYRVLARWSFVAYWLTIFLLIAVLIPGIGTQRFGARRWFDLSFFEFQPSEFAKLAFILAMAHFLGRPSEEMRSPANFWKAIGLMILPFLLILKEPDLGSALVLWPTALTMLFCAGTPRRYLVRFVGALALLAALFVADILLSPPGRWQVKLEQYQRQRLLVYFGADFAPRNANADQAAEARRIQFESSYQVRQALISVGSGGFWGRGWRHGNQTALGFLPPGAAHNDFIFSVIAEEEGFVGSILVLTLYAVVLFCGIRIAGQARDRLGRLLAVGVVALLFSHIFINIGMNIRMVPVTGIPLPLLSYGGSSVVGSLIALGLLQNVYMYRKAY